MFKVNKEKEIQLDENTLQEILTERVYADSLNEDVIDDNRMKELILWHSNVLARNYNLSLDSTNKLQEFVFNRLRKLGKLQPLLDSPDITEIMVNGPEKVFYEKNGELIKSDIKFKSQKELNNMLLSFFSKHNVNLSISNPAANLRLADGSRAHAVIPPIAPDGPIFTIRKFTGIKPTIKYLLNTKFLTEDISNYLEKAVKAKHAIIIGGGTGSGKTTLLNILSGFIEQSERIITIEDTAELQLQDKDNWVRLISRQDKNNKDNDISINTLISHALRMRPDRIIIGEVRGDEAYDMLKAAQTGHPGTLCTIHANDVEGIIYRLADLALVKANLAYDVLIRQIVSLFKILIHIKRDVSGARYINQIAELSADKNNIYKLKYIYQKEL